MFLKLYSILFFLLCSYNPLKGMSPVTVRGSSLVAELMQKKISAVHGHMGSTGLHSPETQYHVLGSTYHSSPALLSPEYLSYHKTLAEHAVGQARLLEQAEERQKTEALKQQMRRDKEVIKQAIDKAKALKQEKPLEVVRKPESKILSETLESVGLPKLPKEVLEVVKNMQQDELMKELLGKKDILEKEHGKSIELLKDQFEKEKGELLKRQKEQESIKQHKDLLAEEIVSRENFEKEYAEDYQKMQDSYQGLLTMLDTFKREKMTKQEVEDKVETILVQFKQSFEGSKEDDLASLKKKQQLLDEYKQKLRSRLQKKDTHSVNSKEKQDDSLKSKNYRMAGAIQQQILQAKTEKKKLKSRTRLIDKSFWEEVHDDVLELLKELIDDTFDKIHDYLDQKMAELLHIHSDQSVDVDDQTIDDEDEEDKEDIVIDFDKILVLFINFLQKNKLSIDWYDDSWLTKNKLQHENAVKLIDSFFYEQNISENKDVQKQLIEDAKKILKNNLVIRWIQDNGFKIAHYIFMKDNNQDIVDYDTLKKVIYGLKIREILIPNFMQDYFVNYIKTMIQELYNLQQWIIDHGKDLLNGLKNKKISIKTVTLIDIFNVCTEGDIAFNSLLYDGLDTVQYFNFLINGMSHV